jgi:hypothetical protein
MASGPDDLDEVAAPAPIPRGNPFIQFAVYVALAAFGALVILWLLANT